MKLLKILLLCGSALAQTPAVPAKGALNKATLEAYLRRVEPFQVEVRMKIDDPVPSKYLPGFLEVAVHLTSDGGSKEELYYISQDGQTIVQGDPGNVTVFNISKNPFQSNLDKLFTEGQPSFGPANAPVTIVEFGDLGVPRLKAEAPSLRQLVPQMYPDKVRVVFKDFPLESVHPWARAAAMAGRCVFHQNQQTFWKFYDWTYDTQEQITPETLRPKVIDMGGEQRNRRGEVGAVHGYQGDRRRGREEHRRRPGTGNPRNAQPLHQRPKNRRSRLRRPPTVDR